MESFCLEPCRGRLNCITIIGELSGRVLDVDCVDNKIDTTHLFSVLLLRLDTSISHNWVFFLKEKMLRQR